MKRLLLLGPAAGTGYVGGLQLALTNLADELRSRGWEVDSSLETPCRPGGTPVEVRTSLAGLQSFALLVRIRQAIPSHWRRTVSARFWPQSAYDVAAQALWWAERKLERPDLYRSVLVCPDFNVPGMLALALASHPRVVVVSLDALAEELRTRLWSFAQRRSVHPFFYKPALAGQIHCAVFASEHWRQQAINAGLAPSAAHTIYFGVPLAVSTPRQRESEQRLLWVGRLAPEKGLHLLLAALPRLPGVTLTAIAAQGEPEYRARILNLIRDLGLQGVVTLHPPVAREALSDIYASHDLLFFHSSYPEPVALVLMEAYAAGLPVVANQVDGSDLVRNGETCHTYNPQDAYSMIAAIRSSLGDAITRDRMSRNARAIVEANYSLKAMGAAYDRLLCGNGAD